ncbi:4Fe-4S dicluster domain-containing protein [Humitalea sp. 24SJ18S-53]|uniref:4Fe-4S dicluster domain-containing protein n=1 Tax=Humitalea sp. 24SJ18S-53 TaxID=3422307 RepID=UPI003D66F0D4
MTLDTRVVARGCKGEVRGAEQLCRAQLDRFLAAMGDGDVTVACTQEAPLFAQEAEAAGHAGALHFVNIREQAGWSDEGAQASPKMAAILAAAAEPMPQVPQVTLQSSGVALVLGRDASALAAAARLAEALDVTVLLTGDEPVAPMREAAFPVLRGRATGATGWLGAFEVAVGDVASPKPSSRAAYAWGPGKPRSTSRCDLVIDLTGGAALFHETRQGYLRADPDDAGAVAAVVAEASGLVGTFDQPRFITFDAGLCAHSRNKRIGCTRCLDLCPTGAITPGKDSVLVSAEICAGCGACAAVCPTGAARYALPPADALARRARALLLTYRDAGGAAPVLLLHDAANGTPLIEALARHGDGLPANVLPLQMNEVSAADLSLFAGGFAWGATRVVALLPARRPHGTEGLFRAIDTANAILDGLGLGARAGAIETDDPFTLGEALRALPPLPFRFAPGSFLPMGAPREIALAGWRALREAAAAPVATIALPALAGFGAAEVKADGCTLCLACTMVCPTGAFAANPDTPELSFLEDACVQCGLCVATCPEKVISLVPRLDLRPEAAQRRIAKAEAPAACTKCQKPFGTRSSIDRVKQKLAAHWMFADPARFAVLEMCEDCRAVEATLGGVDPYAGAPRPVTKTTEDWRREAERDKA